LAGCSDFDLLRYGQSVVYIDAQISHRALDLRVSKQKLNCAQIAGAAIDQKAHSITSSARATIVGGTSRPSAFAWNVPRYASLKGDAFIA
jgi:hypothetical protein